MDEIVEKVEEVYLDNKDDANTLNFNNISKKPKKSKDDSDKSHQTIAHDENYSSLLVRIFTRLREQNPDLTNDRKKYTMIPPNIQREGNKKTLFANITDILARLNRPREHLVQFLFAELGTNGSTDGNQRLLIKGKFQQKQIENVLKRYIVEYVTCKTCRSPNTRLNKENRLFFMQCESCGSVRTVSTIKTGFKAQIEKRSVQKNKES